MHMWQHPGWAITTDVLASMVAQAYLTSFTPVNILSGFKKMGVYPFNPNAVDDWQLAPSAAFQTEKPIPTSNADEASCGMSYEGNQEVGQAIQGAEGCWGTLFSSECACHTRVYACCLSHLTSRSSHWANSQSRPAVVGESFCTRPVSSVVDKVTISWSAQGHFSHLCSVCT